MLNYQRVHVPNMLPMSLGDHWKVDKSGNFRVFFLPSWRGNDPIFFHNLRKVDEQTPSPLGALQRPFKGPSTQIYLTSQSKGFLEIAEMVGSSCPTNASSLISSKDASNRNFK